MQTYYGLLHRATEKIAEVRYWFQTTPLFTRLDYVSTVSQEWGFLDTLSDLCTWFPRIWAYEASRVLNHLLALSCHIADLGAVSLILWCFEYREEFLYFFERGSGIRLHTRVAHCGIDSPSLVTEGSDIVS